MSGVTLCEASPSLPRGRHLAGLIFDVDGTLYSQSPVRRAMAWRLVRAGLSRPFTTWREFQIVRHYRRAQEYLRRQHQPLADSQWDLACAWSGADLDQAKRTIGRWMEAEPASLLEWAVRPGVAELLAAASKHGTLLGVLSDYPAATKLRAMGLDTYFSTVLSAQDPDVGEFKPSPKGIFRMLQEWGVDAPTTVYVGDRPSVDAEAARRAGVACIIVGQKPGTIGPGWTGAPDFLAIRTLLEI